MSRHTGLGQLLGNLAGHTAVRALVYRQGTGVLIGLVVLFLAYKAHATWRRGHPIRRRYPSAQTATRRRNR